MIDDTVLARLWAVAHRGGTAHPLQMLGQSPPAGLDQILLASRVSRRRKRVHPPMVKHFGNMNDPFRFFAGAQDQIVILSAVETVPQAAEFFKQRTTQYQ